MKSSKVWYVSKYAMTPKYGNPTRQFFFSKYLAKLGREVTLIASQSNPLFKGNKDLHKQSLSYKEDHVAVVLLKGRRINLGFNLKRIYSWILFEIRFLTWAVLNRKKKPDVLIVSSLSILTFLSGIFLKKVFGCRLICEVRDIYPLTLVKTKNWSYKNPIVFVLYQIEKFAYRHADFIVGSMPNFVEHVASISKGDESKVKFIPTGVDLGFYKASNKDPFENSFRTLVPEEHLIVGYAGTIGLVNCVDEIIESACILKGYKITFVLLGDGPLKEKMQEQIINKRLDNVIFFDTVPKNEVIHFLKKCDLVLNPWKKNPGLYKYGVSPNKWIDYLYCSKPIIVSLNGFHHLINEAGCGEFIDSGDPKLLAETILKFNAMERGELVLMGERGRKYLEENLTYTKLTEEYIKIIDRLCINYSSKV